MIYKIKRFSEKESLLTKKYKDFTPEDKLKLGLGTAAGMAVACPIAGSIGDYISTRKSSLSKKERIKLAKKEGLKYGFIAPVAAALTATGDYIYNKHKNKTNKK